MSPKELDGRVRPRLAAGAALALAATGAALAAAGEVSVSVGPAARVGMEATVRGRSHAQAEGWHSARPGRWLTTPAPGSDPGYRYADGSALAQGYGNRRFLDGYVFKDRGTDDPTSIEPGLTWYWGYDSAAQYDDELGLLAFHGEAASRDVQTVATTESGQSTAVRVLRDEAIDADDRVSGAGIGVELRYAAVERARWSVSVSAGLRCLWGMDSRMEASPYEESVRVSTLSATTTRTFDDTHRYRDTYTYDTEGVAPPAAPHAGTYDGPGPVIPNTPSGYRRDVVGTDRQVATAESPTVQGSRSWTAASRATFDLDAALYALSIGSLITLQAGERVGFFLLPSLTLNWIDLEAASREEAVRRDRRGATVLAAWSESGSDLRFSPGAGVAAGVRIAVADGWAIDLQGGYDWVSRDADVELGPATVSFDASGYSAGAALVREF